MKKNGSKHFVAQYFTGEILVQLGRFEESLPYFKEAIQINPNAKECLVSLGNAFQKLKLFEKALESYEKAVNIDNQYAIAFLNQGLTYMQMDQLEKSLIYLQKAAELGLKEANMHKALVLHKLGKNEESLETFNIIINKYPDNLQFRTYKCMVLVKLERIQEAIKCLDELIEISPDNEEAYIRKESLLDRQYGNSSQELKDFQNIMIKKGFLPQILE
ncbi:hypothetical protein PPERSA_05488 [Pseudocohnilembus persalinus]|uniref:Uncharacterized protein n=1 Tax=Pseudocohnilembus persalinus TaxID=266149 RepID=A0A0V0QCU0_PSEPJ|nr:hypothetical protein PPERSA_05488 [Pseudocohnilembus persalinus]|eukprot:KRW99985.1 hypothetical protein PPERSA_05488 [Pseudocohnilembus persalinus]